MLTWANPWPAAGWRPGREALPTKARAKPAPPGWGVTSRKPRGPAASADAPTAGSSAPSSRTRTRRRARMADTSLGTAARCTHEKRRVEPRSAGVRAPGSPSGLAPAERRELAAAAHAELAVDVARVGADGLHAHVERQGDLGVRAPVLEQLEHVGLAR